MCLLGVSGTAGAPGSDTMAVNVDLAKRRRIMQRSMKLGHCVCDPKRPCPCDVFQKQGICLCAGERPDPVDISKVRLTELVHNAGCASKISPGDLEAVLNRLPKVDDPQVISGIPAGDDAGVYKLDNNTTLVQTVDVFTPCVDDPELFGRICAANCLSDIYAMGGVPLTALSILCFPVETQDGRIMYHMLKGAMDVLAEAGVSLLGGHSVKDSEIKLGFAITGTVSGNAVEHGSASVGDLLVLTKPLGTGVLNFARQIGRVKCDDMREAEQSMVQLNKAASEAMIACGASACTDVTGFGLFGHLISMARHSGVTAQIWADKLPALPGALQAFADGIVPGAIERNQEYVAEDISIADNVDEALVYLGFDAQTSGGLLICIPSNRHGELLGMLRKGGAEAHTVGQIVEESRGGILVTNSDESCCSMGKLSDYDEDLPVGVRQEETANAGSCCCSGDQTAETGCCESTATETVKSENTSGRSEQAFKKLMGSTMLAGTIDSRSKELINFALAVVTRCGPCVRSHLSKARKMGISQEELDEVAWCAVAMGGAPVRMFYLEILESVNANVTPDAEDSCCCKN